jgi:7,8-dihydroneopterin aldolase/epimerase/oxygenase
MDCIFLREIKLEAKVGIYRRERVTSQLIELDLDIALPSDAVFRSGKVADTVDYAIVVQRLRDELAVQRFGLVEELAEHIARVVLDEYHSPWVRVSVAKLGIIKGVKHVGVTIERPRPAT